MATLKYLESVGGRAKRISDIQGFFEDVSCSILSITNTDSGVDLVVDDGTHLEITVDSNPHVQLSIDGTQKDALVFWSMNTMVWVFVYSDNFIFFFDYSNQFNGGGAKFSYLYEKLDTGDYEGWLSRSGGSGSDIHVYDYLLRNKETGAAYKHGKLFNYVSEQTELGEPTIEYSTDVLFDPSGEVITRIENKNLLNTTKVAKSHHIPDSGTPLYTDRFNIITYGGKEYFSIETNLLVPLFDTDSSDSSGE